MMLRRSLTENLQKDVFFVKDFFCFLQTSEVAQFSFLQAGCLLYGKEVDSRLQAGCLYYGGLCL